MVYLSVALRRVSPLDCRLPPHGTHWLCHIDVTCKLHPILAPPCARTNYLRYRLIRTWFALTQHWTQFDPFFDLKEETFKSSGAAVYRTSPPVPFLFLSSPTYERWVELALTMSEINAEAAKSSLGTDEKRLEVLFDEMIQMCFWYAPFPALPLPLPLLTR